jgi:multidrug efflux pump subunit AcrA (membrane-fusion protein)
MKATTIITPCSAAIRLHPGNLNPGYVPAMKHMRPFIPVLALLWLLICVVGTPHAAAQDDLMVMPARKHVTLKGYTRSRSTMNVASEVAGKVLRVHYDVGQTITNHPFVQIDPTFIDFQIAQADLTLKKLKVSADRVASRTTYLETEFQRVSTLLKGDATTQTRYDTAAEELSQTRLELQATRLEINTLKTQLAELQERRRRYTVSAPPGWVVVERRIEPGEIIAAGTLLARVADYGSLVVPLYVSAEELAALEEIEPTSILLEGRPAHAALNWVNPEFDERSRKSAIELLIQDYNGHRRGGLVAEISLEVTAQGAMVPKAAVQNRLDNPHVILKADGTVIPIVILGENGSHVIIADNAALPPGTVLRSAY